jgi:hypothetical protein
LASSGELHGDGTMELHIFATIGPLSLKEKFPSFFFPFSFFLLLFSPHYNNNDDDNNKEKCSLSLFLSS